MFETLKRELDLVKVVEDILNTELKTIGDSTVTTDDDTCPFCGHKDCFRIKMESDNSFFKCFSCDASGDVTHFTALYNKVSDVEAAKILAKKYEIRLPSDYSPVQEAMNLAAAYYHNCFLDSKPCAELAGLTPSEYQTNIRKHIPSSFEEFQLGWSDGKVTEYLNSLGVSEEIILATGLLSKKGTDFLPSKVFIYPHKVRGRVSHFTFKDPLKQKEYQLPNRYKLNGHSFYNSDSISNDTPVIIVEGENDLISVKEAGWTGGVIASIGNVSSSQLEWMELTLADKDVITIFDTDPAGDKYREKVDKLKSRFRSLTQLKLDLSIKDIDEYLKKGGNLNAIIESGEVQTVESGSTQLDSDIADDTNIMEKGGCYYKVRYKEGSEFLIKLTDFVIKLHNIYIRNSEREREASIVREDGKRAVIKITSDAKVSLKPFKLLAANAVDGSFYGKEEDLLLMWNYIYKNNEEKEVHLSEVVGNVDNFKGWLFGDCYITDTGSKYLADDFGVFWITNGQGIKPLSINSADYKLSNKNAKGIPRINTGLERENRKKIIKGFIDNLSSNIGNRGDAIILTAWCWASIYSEMIHIQEGFFPYLLLWGTHGKGKSTIIKWLLSIFDMAESGYTTLDQLNTGVSFSRKLGYYSCLPTAIDEIRASPEMEKWVGTFRSWYNRTGRAISDKEGFGVKETPVRSTVIFGGQDQVMDGAARSRYIPIRIPVLGRELVKSYAWFNANKKLLPSIAYEWISTYSSITEEDLLKETNALDEIILKLGASNRTSKIWSCIGLFGVRLTEEFCPEFNFLEYLLESSKNDTQGQAEDDMVIQFWEVIEGMQSGEHAKITGDHLRREGSTLYVWFAEIFRVFERETVSVNRNRFSKRAVLEAMREEPYFIKEDRIKLGMVDNVRRVIALDLSKSPEVINRIANCLG
jgi:5S rRNA maturation endonuclease (ribonuclease M5)